MIALTNFRKCFFVPIKQKMHNNKTCVFARSTIAAARMAVLGGLVLAAVGVTAGIQTVHAQVDCSVVSCTSADQPTISGYNMFDETNFAPVVDGLGRSRQFYVHIPPAYDTLAAQQLMPVIFAFHGGGQDRMAMVDGKWGDDYFNQEIAFVVPLAEPEHCDTTAYPKRVWMQPGFRAGVPAGVALPANCDAATQQFNSLGDPVTYWNASLTNTFTDVVFAENLRTAILERFPKLNPQKVYATGFSSGGGMTLSLLCYRSTLFRGFSVVAKSLVGEAQRGDLAGNGSLDPNSLLATCGKSRLDAGGATGLAEPKLWGYGIIALSPPPLPHLYWRNTKPVVLFAGDQDDTYTTAEINDTGAEIRARNNLTGLNFLVSPFMNTQADEAETQRRIFSTVGSPLHPSSTFTRYLVRRVDDPAINPNLKSAGHAMPDVDEPPTATLERMTSDFNYTDRTVIFFQSHADMNLNP